MLKRPGIFCAILFCAAAFLFGVVRLFELRFDRGDIYPAYSTLRTDPLGTSVFYESLQRLPGVSAERFFEERFKNDEGRASALFVLGAQPDAMRQFSRPEFDVLQRFVLSGGRVVIAYYPAPGESRSARRARLAGTNSVDSTNNVKHKNSGDEDDREAERRHYVDLSEEWSFSVAYKNLETNEDGHMEFPNAELVARNRGLPPLLAVHTALCFTNMTNWSTIYQRDRKTPVVVERKSGAGSVVLVADSYPFSNEAMFKDLHAPLLGWLLGSGRAAIFDEAHLGMVEQPGVVSLMRRYQLHGLFFSLIVAAGLFVWKNSLSLVPPHAETESHSGPVIAGRDSASGFVNLARRGIAPAEIINVCFTEWKKSGARRVAISPAQRRELEQFIQQQAALPPRQRQPVEDYRAISQILQRRK